MDHYASAQVIRAQRQPDNSACSGRSSDARASCLSRRRRGNPLRFRSGTSPLVPRTDGVEHERIDPNLVPMAKAQLGEVVDESFAWLPQPEGHRAIRVHHYTAPADHVPQIVEAFNDGDRVAFWVGTAVHRIQGTRSVLLHGTPNDAPVAHS